MKLINPQGVSEARLEPSKNQPSSPRNTRSRSRQQQSSQGSSRRVQDRSGEQDSAPPLCCPVPAVTDSSSSQLSQDSAAISLPKSVPGVERLDFDPPTHPSVSPNTGRLNIPEITLHPSPASSAGYSWLFGESSEPSSLLQYSPLPNPSSLRSLPAIVVNPSLPSRPHSAPASPTLSRSVLPKFPSHYRNHYLAQLSIPLPSTL